MCLTKASVGKSIGALGVEAKMGRFLGMYDVSIDDGLHHHWLFQKPFLLLLLLLLLLPSLFSIYQCSHLAFSHSLTHSPLTYLLTYLSIYLSSSFHHHHHHRRCIIKASSIYPVLISFIHSWNTHSLTHFLSVISGIDILPHLTSTLI